MSEKSEKLPYKISEYIQNNFREGFLCEVKRVNDAKGQPIYKVQVDQDDMIYHLKFDESGNLLREETDPAFPENHHDDPTLSKEGFHPEDY